MSLSGVAASAAAVVLSAALVFSAGERPRQSSSDDPHARAALARATFDATARVLTVYDQQGQLVRTVGDRAIYTWPAFSPDGTRLAVSKRDEATGHTDIWVFDLATGDGRPITADAPTDISPVWSPDGAHIVYASDLGGSPALYRKASDGSGNPGLLFDPGVPFYVTDWSADGRFLTVSDPENLHVLPLAAGFSRRRLPGRGARFSPDGRLVAYVANDSGRPEVWVRPIEPPVTGDVSVRGPWRISDNGGAGMVFWRQDGREIYYLSADEQVMAVEVGLAPTFTAAPPRRLFKAPDVISGSINGTSVTRDGRHFLFNVAPKPRGQSVPARISVFDRKGTLVRTLVELPSETTPTTPVLSPDGASVAVFLDNDITVFDVSSGTRTQVTRSAAAVKRAGDQQSPVWSPDGRHLAFVSFRENRGHVLRVPVDGTGREELLYSHLPDIYAMPLADWSPDGRFLTFDVGGVSWILPLGAQAASVERQATELIRDEFNVFEARLSPDSRFVAYVSDESGRNEVYVRAWDASTLGFPQGSPKWQISRSGGLGLVQWRRDGAELYYLATDGGVMAVDVTASPVFRPGRARRLFRAPGTLPLVGVFDREGTNAPGCSDATLLRCEPGSISRDGERFVFTVPQPPPRSAITLSRTILAQYTGTYVEAGIEWAVTLEGNQLMIQRTAREKVPLFAETDRRFFLKATNGDFEFVRDDRGQVKFLFRYRGGAPTQMIRQ